MTIIQNGEFKGAIAGTEGNDAIKEAGIIFGLQGNDTLAGDTIYGGKGDDIIFGNEGNNFLRGDQGNDTIYGGDGNDTIYGGKGNDILFSGSGIDILFGGEGSDTFNVKVGDQLPDFNAGEDVLIGNYFVQDGIVRAITVSTPVSPVSPSPTPTPISTIPTIPKVEVPVIPVISTPTKPTFPVPDGVKISARNSSLTATSGDDTITGGGNSTLIGAVGDVDNFLVNSNPASDGDWIKSFGSEDKLLIPSSFSGKVGVSTDERFPGIVTVNTSSKNFAFILGASVEQVKAAIVYI